MDEGHIAALGLKPVPAARFSRNVAALRVSMFPEVLPITSVHLTATSCTAPPRGVEGWAEPVHR
jgi:hypothetical protein